MNWPQNFKVIDALKIGGIVLIAFVVLALGIRLVSTPFSTMMGGGFGPQATATPPMFDGVATEMVGDVSLSTRNVAGIMPQPNTNTSGSDAENFEVTNYRGTIETGNAEKTCQTIAAWKDKDYVVFENSNEGDTFCDYTFKVKQANVAEVKSELEKLEPQELVENKYTIKNQVEDFTSETDILKKKAETIDATLKNALIAYDEITALATRSQDAGALAKVIDSKLQMVERLTQERLNITAQLERLGRAKAQQLDGLEYTYFTINVYENKYFDGEGLKDSWKRAMREFMYDLNKVAQDLSIGLVTLAVWALQFVLYLFIVIFVAKYVWRGSKYIWNK